MSMTLVIFVFIHQIMQLILVIINIKDQVVLIHLEIFYFFL